MAGRGQGGNPTEGPPPSLREVETMAQSLLVALRRSQQLPNATNSGQTTPSGHTTTPTTQLPVPVTSQVNQKLKRQFSTQSLQSMGDMKRGRGRFCSSKPSAPVKMLDLTICVLPGPTDLTPKPANEMDLVHAGLGKRVVQIPEEGTHAEVQSLLEHEFIKLRPLQGRWLLNKATGGSGQRKLGQVLMDTNAGYTGKLLRKASNNGKVALFLVPLQEELNTSPLPFDAPEFAGMPQVPCNNCGTTMPLQMLQLHTELCKPAQKEQSIVLDEDTPEEEPEDVVSEEQGVCPICQQEFPMARLPGHASVCAEISYNATMEDEVPGTSSAVPGSSSSSAASGGAAAEAWKTVKSPKEAKRLYTEELRRAGDNQPDLVLVLNARDSQEDRDRDLINFYKDEREKKMWAAHFKCRILGDAAVGAGVARHSLSAAVSKLTRGFELNLGNSPFTALFEGESDHLTPSLATALVDSDLFVMAGRIIGHSAVHGGPPLPGLSPAVIDALIGDEMAKAKLCLEDCPEVDHRETMALLLKEEDWSEEETARVENLCKDWFCPVPTKDTNRLLLFQQLLYHAVLGRSHQAIKQIRRGLKDTGIMPLLVERKDVAPLLFPCMADVILTPQDVLPFIEWPQSTARDSDESDEEVAPGTMTTICGFFRRFVMEASSDNLHDLMKFWTAHEVPEEESESKKEGESKPLKIEIIHSSGRNKFPTSSSCAKRIRIPDHYSSYPIFKEDLMVCLLSVETGFGLV